MLEPSFIGETPEESHFRLVAQAPIWEFLKIGDPKSSTLNSRYPSYKDPKISTPNCLKLYTSLLDPLRGILVVTL